MGIKAVESHMQGAKHKMATESQKQTPGISHFCVGPAPQLATTAAAATAGATAGASSTDLAVIFGGTATLKSEVLWILNTVVKHQSYTSNEGIGDLFHVMFPDSQIANTFSCGKDKTAYVTRHGLAPHIQNLLIDEVNRSRYVLMSMKPSIIAQRTNNWMSIN